jgi:N-acetyltransferase 10
LGQSADIHTEAISIRDPAKMPPLLHRLSEVQPEPLDYLSVSYGLTPSLFKFWKRSHYTPLYIRQTTNELTGEHSCVMIKGLSNRQTETKEWLSSFAQDFHRRFLSLLSYKFREFASVTALSIMEACNAAGSPAKPRLGIP